MGDLSVASDPAYLIEQLKLVVKHPETLNNDETHRAEIQRLGRLMSVALETQQESMQRIQFAHLPLVTTRISNDSGLFTALSKGDDVNPVAIADLAKASGLDKNLVSILMDYHCYQGAAIEPRQGFYAPTGLTHHLLDPKVVKTTTCWQEIVGPAYGALPRRLKRGPDESESGQKTAFQIAHDTTQSFYDWLESRPEQHSIFYGFMAANHAITARWLDVIRFDEEIAAGADANEVVFVDIGGGDGAQAIEVHQVHQGGGRVIMQDRPAVIEKATKAHAAGVETMAYDFFTEQPVKGARAYFIQFVLLNWDDAECVRILASQTPAMGPASVLMIVDFVQGHRWERSGGPREPDLYTPATALAARACHDAKGRSRADYRDLLERAGLELTEVRIFTDAGQAVIMAKKP
ncbi:MAG: hypothetical protein M4579_002565 [Chaenotheca gracillima]|nr:MAG: hypothetical protein M4579_002565 [Chaenotheca gracillima]